MLRARAELRCLYRDRFRVKVTSYYELWVPVTRLRIWPPGRLPPGSAPCSLETEDLSWRRSGKKCFKAALEKSHSVSCSSLLHNPALIHICAFSSLASNLNEHLLKTPALITVIECLLQHSTLIKMDVYFILLLLHCTVLQIDVFSNLLLL
jgi:hypothetical protein